MYEDYVGSHADEGADQSGKVAHKIYGCAPGTNFNGPSQPLLRGVDDVQLELVSQPGAQLHVNQQTHAAERRRQGAYNQRSRTRRR